MTTNVTAGDSLRNAFGQALVGFAPEYDFTLFDGDVAGGTGCAAFRDKFSTRFIQSGIAEQAAVGLAAGYALASGKKAIVSTFACFGARAWEIFRLSAAYNKADVLLVLSHLGLSVGPDGASAQALEYIPLWCSLPGVTVVQPATPAEMRQAVKVLLEKPGPAVLFTGRSQVNFSLPENYEFKLGHPQAVHNTLKYPDAVIFATGQAVGVGIAAANELREYGLYCRVINVSTLTPFNPAHIRSLLYGRLGIVLEDHGQMGLYNLLAGAVITQRSHSPLYSIRVVGWGESGEEADLYHKHDLTGEGVACRIRQLL